MANAKLHINLHQGLIEAEGEEAFVLKHAPPPPPANPGEKPPNAEDKPGRAAPKRRTRRNGGREATGDTEAPGVSKYTPNRDPSLDLSKLKDFIAPYKPKNNAEKIVIYAHFLRDVLKKDPCSVDQVYSCFRHMKDKVPEAFGQAFINTRGDTYGYITFTSVNDIKLTIAGENHFERDIPKAEATAA